LRRIDRVIVKLCSIWLGRFSLTKPGIESIRGLTDFDLTEMLWQDMIQDSEFSPFKDFSLGVRERRVESERGDQMVMIEGLEQHHDSSSRRLAWDPGPAMFDSSTINTDGIAIFRVPKCTPRMLRIGCLGEWSPEELTEFMQLMIAWLIRDSQMDYCVSTLQISATSRVCFTLPRLPYPLAIRSLKLHLHGLVICGVFSNRIEPLDSQNHICI
jgi:hypothetical protein